MCFLSISDGWSSEVFASTEINLSSIFFTNEVNFTLVCERRKILGNVFFGYEKLSKKWIYINLVEENLFHNICFFFSCSCLTCLRSQRTSRIKSNKIDGLAILVVQLFHCFYARQEQPGRQKFKKKQQKFDRWENNGM